MAARTDLALERISQDSYNDSGIHSTIRGNVFRITDIRIDSDSSGRRIGKPKGKYLTLETSALSRFSDNYQEMTEEFSLELSSFFFFF